MNRDTTIVQVAILFIVIAILGVAIFNKQNGATWENESKTKTVVVQQINEWTTQINTGSWTTISYSWSSNTNLSWEYFNSPRTNVIKQYFAYIANKEYQKACSLLTNWKCASIRPWAVENFTIEFDKLKNGYEYLNIKDYWIVAPSGKNVTCVKYSYRYKNDPNPSLISEVLSFYTLAVDWEILITDRVCEKKYKDWVGIRPCPIEPNARFCDGKVK